MTCHKGVFTPQLFNIYTNDQPVHDGTRTFSYADDLCITAQFPTFSQVESTIEEVLGELTESYRNNSLSLRANPDKTQVTAFHLRNRETKSSLKVSWNGVDLENTTHPKYVGVTLDRTLNYKHHIQNTKVATHNNILNKFANSKWGTNANTNRTTALALCYSIAEYAAPVCVRYTYADILDSELNKACRASSQHLWKTCIC